MLIINQFYIKYKIHYLITLAGANLFNDVSRRRYFTLMSLFVHLYTFWQELQGCIIDLNNPVNMTIKCEELLFEIDKILWLNNVTSIRLTNLNFLQARNIICWRTCNAMINHNYMQIDIRNIICWRTCNAMINHNYM